MSLKPTDASGIAKLLRERGLYVLRVLLDDSARSRSGGRYETRQAALDALRNNYPGVKLVEADTYDAELRRRWTRPPGRPVGDEEFVLISVQIRRDQDEWLRKHRGDRRKSATIREALDLLIRNNYSQTIANGPGEGGGRRE